MPYRFLRGYDKYRYFRAIYIHTYQTVKLVDLVAWTSRFAASVAEDYRHHPGYRTRCESKVVDATHHESTTHEV